MKNKKLYIGIDVGGTNMRGGIFRSGSTRPLGTLEIKTPKTKAKFLTALNTLAATLAAKHKIAGIGIGLPGTVDHARGILIRAKRIPFLKNWNIQKFFATFKAPVKADNDCKCFLTAEATYGAGRGYKNIVAIAIGSGIGSGIMIDGKIYRGGHNTAGEIGHTVIDGNRTFEQLAAKDAFLKHGDRSAVIGIGIANAINTFDPDVVIIGGGGGLSRHVHLPTVRTAVRRHVIRSLLGKTKITKAELGDFGPAIGAAILLQT